MLIHETISPFEEKIAEKTSGGGKRKKSSFVPFLAFRNLWENALEDSGKIRDNTTAANNDQNYD